MDLTRREAVMAKKSGSMFPVKHPGALHKALKVPEGKTIPKAKLEKAAHSKSPLMRKRAVYAENMQKGK
jgi:hypothetical protein